MAGTRLALTTCFPRRVCGIRRPSPFLEERDADAFIFVENARSCETSLRTERSVIDSSETVAHVTCDERG